MSYRFSVGNKNARDRWLTEDEEKDCLAVATNPQWLEGFSWLRFIPVCRKGRDPLWPQIDFTRRMITVVRSGRGEKRAIPMSNFTSSVLKGVEVGTFVGKVSLISERSLRVAFGETLRRAAYLNFKFHDLRHTFATRLVQNGVDLYKVKELLGHKTLSMTAGSS